MSPAGSSGPNRAWRWTVAVFAVAVFTRLLWISVPLNVDEGLWMRRGPAFLHAVLQGRPADTYQRHHPGVTNMWIIGSAVASRYLLRDGVPAGELARRTAPVLQASDSLPDYLAAAAGLPVVPLELFVAARILAALVTAACMAGFYALSRRLFGASVAAIAVLILLFEPFFLGYQRFLTTDANQTNFTWLALLAFLLFLRAVGGGQAEAVPEVRRSWWGWSLLSGILLGLALLSKISAAISLPAFVLALVWWTGTTRTRGARIRLAAGVGVWALAAVAAMALPWPALGVDPLGTVARFFDGLTGEINAHAQFFLGHSTEDPGFAFYPVVLVYRLSPLLLIGSILGVISLVTPSLRRHLRDPIGLSVILLDIAVVLIAVSVVASKLDRYILPLVPGLALLAASGISATVSRADELLAREEPGRRPRFLTPLRTLHHRPIALLGLVLVLQLAVLLPHIPSYVTYFNPLAGGPVLAQKLLMVGNGELLDQAGAWIRREAPNGEAWVASWQRDSLGPYYGGPTLSLGLRLGDMPPAWRLVDYVVLYVNNVQRNMPESLVDYFRPQRPLFEAKSHGVSYVRIYAGPAVDEASLAEVANRVDLNFEDSARLAGYDLETPETPAGQEAVLALYWQALKAFPERDFTVQLGIRDPDGNKWAESNRVPVSGTLPVDQWLPGQIVRDVQQVTVPPGTPPGEYDLEVSFWSPTRQRALEIRDRGAPVGNRAALTKLRVTRPARPPALMGESRDPSAADLQIANHVEGEVRLAPDAARLIGYQWPQPATARAGDGFPMVLLWQAGTHNTPDVQLRLRLTQEESHWQRAAAHPLGGSYAPDNWQPGELVRDTWNALLPAGAPAGRYQVELLAATPDGDKVLLDLGSIDLLARRHSFEAPSPQVAQNAALRNPRPSAGLPGVDVARLVGYALPAALQPGQELPLTLYWQALAEAERNYFRFVHLLDADDRIVAQQDSVPGDGQTPLTSWQVGEYVQDDLAIAIPTGLPPGEYRLAVGMYDPATGQRLTTDSGQGQILLSSQLAMH